MTSIYSNVPVVNVLISNLSSQDMLCLFSIVVVVKEDILSPL